MSGTRAVCLRCGTDKGAFDRICPACGHVPDGEGLLVAWLLSDANLDDAGLAAAAARIRGGESIRPSERMLERARVALGRHASRDPGLDGRQRLVLLGTSLLLTSLPGIVLWAWWREERPRSAVQALALSLPASALALGLVAWAAWLRG